MLTRLSVQNYAIIRQLSVEFAPNLNVITGETGAGKSIILGALGLILGERADSNVLMNKEKKCVIEGSFSANTQEASIQHFFEEQDVDYSEEIIIRREIGANGKSRAFINDTPVNLGQLSKLSSLLVDLHQQFDSLEVGNEDFQIEVIDALAGNESLIRNFRIQYRALAELEKELSNLISQKESFQKELDFHQFQFNELEEAGLKPDELEQLEEELKLLSNAEEIRQTLSTANFTLKESEEPLLQKLKTLINDLQGFNEIHPGLPEISTRLHSTYVELQDISSEIEHLSDKISTDESRLQQINDRISLGYRLLKKHSVKTTNELLSIKDDLHDRLQQIFNVDYLIEECEKNRNKAFEQASLTAEKISKNRLSAIPGFEKKVNKMLAQVGMPNAQLRVRIEQAAKLNQNGKDEIEFLFNANISRNNGDLSSFLPVRKVASGGELSRLMLCIKSLVAASIDMPTLIFDEIDTGISGEAAKQVGIILKQLAANRQIISITHQPQLAGKADAHYFVYKHIEDDAINTGIRLLTNEERIVAIAKMLSGEKPTAAALENARELIMN